MYHFDLPYEECLRWRLGRNYDPPDPEGYFVGHVWNASMKAKQDAIDRFHLIRENFVNTANESFDQVAQRIIADIHRRLSEKCEQ